MRHLQRLFSHMRTMRIAVVSLVSAAKRGVCCTSACRVRWRCVVVGRRREDEEEEAGRGGRLLVDSVQNERQVTGQHDGGIESKHPLSSIAVRTPPPKPHPPKTHFRSGTVSLSLHHRGTLTAGT
jgi:hypothetical protein